MTEAMLLAARKTLGAFYTPNDAAHYMAAWAIRHHDDVVLEPSIGDGVFLTAAADLAAARAWEHRPRFVASEINPSAAKDVIARGIVDPEEVRLGDFLTAPITSVDAVIGNPPYVRLRALPHEQATTALDVTRSDLGTRMETSGSVWVPFVSRAAKNLNPGGRLALVLPWDFTYVRYARPLWNHLAEIFGDIRVVRVRERLFPGINQDVLLLLADRKGQTTSAIRFATYRTTSDLIAERPETEARIPISAVTSGERPFQEALLGTDAHDALAATQAYTAPTRERVAFNIGYVSGDKKYFHPARPHELPDHHLVPSIVDGRSLRRGGLWTSELDDSAARQLWLPTGDLNAAERAYVTQGERLRVHEGYKTSRRTPWWLVPDVRVPDLILSVFATSPVLMLNDQRYAATNSLLCGYMREGTAEEFTASWYTSLTLLNIELGVHSLGGGVLVLVPGEAGGIRVLKEQHADTSSLSDVSHRLRAGDIDSAYAAGDKALESSVGHEAVEVIRQAIETLRQWRIKR